MNYEFAFILDKLTDEIIEKKLLDNLKSFLVGARIQPEEEIKQVCYKSDIQITSKALLCLKFWNFANFCSTSQNEKQ